MQCKSIEKFQDKWIKQTKHSSTKQQLIYHLKHDHFPLFYLVIKSMSFIITQYMEVVFASAEMWLEPPLDRPHQLRETIYR